MQENLAGKVAIVTGASSGIGRAVARHLAGAGVKLVVTARREGRLRELQRDFEHVVALSGDLTDAAMPDKLISAALEAFGQCDILFHAAGVLHTGTIEDVDTDAMCAMARINFEASVRLTYEVLKHFKKTGSGHLLHMSSILGTKVRPTAGVYAGTKYGIEALAESLRMEVAGTNIKVSTLQPGITITELHDKLDVHPRDALGIQAPLVPEDIVRAVRFILDQPEHVRIPVLMILPGEQAI